MGRAVEGDPQDGVAGNIIRYKIGITVFISSDRSSYSDDGLLYIYLVSLHPKATFSDFDSVP